MPAPTVASEVRQALNDGLIEAVAFAPHAHMSFETIESADWWTTNLDPGTVNCPVVAGVGAVNNLAPEYQEALYGSINEALDHYINNYNVNTMKAWGPALSERGIEKVTFDKSEIDSFRARVAAPAAAAWIKSNSKLGLPAQELYDLVTVVLSGASPEESPLASNFSGSKPVTDTSGQGLLENNVPEIQQASSKGFQAADINTAIAEQTQFIASTDIKEKRDSKTLAVMPEDSSYGEENYLGPPRNGSNVTALTSDPLQYSVEWNMKGNVTVGYALDRLASYIGYELVGNDKLVKKSYKRPLPIMQRHVASTTVGDGFEILSGVGLTIVYDHITRSVMHMAKQTRNSRDELPDCPTNSSVLTVTGDGMYLLPDGHECRF